MIDRLQTLTRGFGPGRTRLSLITWGYRTIAALLGGVSRSRTVYGLGGGSRRRSLS